MSIIDELSKEERWAEFREYKSKHGHLSNREMRELDTYIAEQRYAPVVGEIRRVVNSAGEDRRYVTVPNTFIPQKREINKSGSTKKRVVYTFAPDVTQVFKLMAWLLYRYDSAISDSCYSFRQNISARDAIEKLRRIPDLESKYVLKADIHDYFNSMPVKKICSALDSAITDDPDLLFFLKALLSLDLAYRVIPADNDNDKNNGSAGKTVHSVSSGPRGAMAGFPISAFIADIYLTELDTWFEDLKIPYFRYSDDILLVTSRIEELEACKAVMFNIIAGKGLTINHEKTKVFNPGEPIEFLGFKITGKDVDLSDATIIKMKGKIRRKCRSLYRWRMRHGLDFDRAAKVVIRIFNMKYYDTEDFMDFTWSRWFFPVLTCTDGLHALDEYLVSELRYIETGRHCKANYRITYEHLKELGLRSLVNEYYKFKAEKRALIYFT
ncbi:MAG: hypothetical protein J6U10_02230 [Lachnospiraceae bacterium]|nr:hypothetical protein [Lachnospiraceae bacterium]